MVRESAGLTLRHAAMEEVGRGINTAAPDRHCMKKEHKLESAVPKSILHTIVFAILVILFSSIPSAVTN
jgi:hypothetical protein